MMKSPKPDYTIDRYDELPRQRHAREARSFALAVVIAAAFAVGGLVAIFAC